MKKSTEFLYLTTIGNKTGVLHEIEIWFVEHDGRYYLCSEMRERSHWVKNIRQNPAITFWVNGETYQGTGRALDPVAEPELHRQVEAAFDAKYKWSGGLMVELSPDERI